jgi:acetyl-CoA C-acetyltransferase
MFLDGLEDAYEKGRLMGSFAEDCARSYQFTRAMQDEYALASLTRAQRAIAEGAFDAEIAPMRIAAERAQRSVGGDEGPFKAKPDEISKLKPAFRPDGSITAANASSISDGAAARFALFCLEAGQAVPSHVSSSAVSLTVLEGEGSVTGTGASSTAPLPTAPIWFKPQQ